MSLSLAELAVLLRPIFNIHLFYFVLTNSGILSVTLVDLLVPGFELTFSQAIKKSATTGLELESFFWRCWKIWNFTFQSFFFFFLPLSQFFVSVRFRMTRQISKVITFKEMESRCFFFPTGFFHSAMIARMEAFIQTKFHNWCQVEFSFLLIQDVYLP